MVDDQTVARGGGEGGSLDILLLEDEPATQTLFRRFLEQDGCRVQVAANLQEGGAALAMRVPDVAIVDVHLGGEDGLTFVSQLRQRMADVGIIVVSAEDTLTLAEKAITTGADNYLSKPLVPSALLLAVRKLGELRRSRQRAELLERQLQESLHKTVFSGIVTHSDAMRAVLRLIEKVGPRELAVLIHGESGTGKELVARAIHQRSVRGKGPFVELNCAALPPNLVESELFGHEKGAFTGALAAYAGKIEQSDGGTLFLDEIGELPLEIQPKLLRALQEKRITRVGGKGSIQVDFRLISATNRDLVEEVRASRFREDLFYRIAVFPIKLPPLRDRPEDLTLLLSHFLKEEGMRKPVLAPDALDLLASHHWPGNVRELRNFAQAVTLLAEDSIITEDVVRRYFGTRLAPLTLRPSSAPMAGFGGGSTSRAPVVPSGDAGSVRPLADLEREAILHALKVFSGNVPEAARALGMGRATLYKYLKRHNIDWDMAGSVAED